MLFSVPLECIQHASCHFTACPIFSPVKRAPMEFESQLGVFSPDGRLIQVEYAQNASSQGVAVIIKKDGNSIRVVYDNRQSNSLQVALDKLHLIDEDRQIYAFYSGLKPDSLRITPEAINIIRSHRLIHDEDISLRAVARKLGEFKQKYAVNPSKRPLGLRTVLLGFEDGSPKIFIVETDGNFYEYESCALGQKSDIIKKYMESRQGDFCIYKAAFEVLQRDTKKIRSFILSGDGGLKEVPEDEIKAAVSSEGDSS